MPSPSALAVLKRLRPPAKAGVLAMAAAALALAPPTSAKPPGGPPPVGTLALDVWSDAGERLHLLLAETDPSGADSPALRHLASEDGGETWSDPVAVGEGQAPPFSPHRGMDPQIAGRGDRLVAAWMVAGTGLFGSGPIATAISDDGGRNWSPGPNPADHDSTDGHGFMDLAVDRDGVFHLVWLDNRDGRRGLRHAESHDGGLSWSANASIDPETCECCWNTLALWGDGTVALLYRAKSPRDMALSTRPPSTAGPGDGLPEWSQPATVGTFGWHFEGCPHVGGGLAATGEDGARTLHAAVWTGREGSTGVYHLRSDDGGASWGGPQRLGGSGANHPDLAAMPDGRVAAVWSEPAGEGRAIRAARLGSDGPAWSETSSLSTPGAVATHPKVVPTVQGFRLFWTESGGHGGELAWRSALLDPAE